MKKLALAAAFACATLAGFAGAQNDMRLLFETRGTDTYKDGSPVLDGEFYALVWTPAGMEFAGFRADGALVSGSDEVVAMVPFAKGGRLPLTKKQIAASAVARYSKGVFSVVSLDTRRADGRLSEPATGANGLPYPSAVNGWQCAAASTAGDAALYAALNVSAAIRLENASALPDDVPQPVVTGVRREGDFLVLAVKGTAAFLRYNVAGGETPDAIGTEGQAAAPADGASSADAEIELRVPVDPNAKSGFFKVIRN